MANHRKKTTVRRGIEGKDCSKCGSWTPLDMFARRRERGEWNHVSHCRACNTARKREWYRTQGSEWMRNNNLKNRYGITLSDVRRMVEEQDAECANPACDTPVNDRSPVDHNHETGEVRGLLCQPCNTALGHAKDDPEILRGLAEYVQWNSSGIYSI